MTKEIEGKKQRLEFLKEEFDKEYKKRGNRAMISVAMVVLLIIGGFFLSREMTMSLFAQRVIFISSVLSGISGAIYMDHLSFKKLSYIESRISILKKDVEKIEKEEESTKEQVKKQNNKLNKKSKIINYVDDSIDIKNVDKSKKKNK